MSKLSEFEKELIYALSVDQNTAQKVIRAWLQNHTDELLSSKSLELLAKETVQEEIARAVASEVIQRLNNQDSVKNWKKTYMNQLVDKVNHQVARQIAEEIKTV